MDNKCLICHKKILSHAKKVSCQICKRNCHINCISIKDDEVSILKNSNDWYCMICLYSELPFIHLEDEDEFNKAINEKDHYKRNEMKDVPSSPSLNVPVKGFGNNRNRKSPK